MALQVRQGRSGTAHKAPALHHSIQLAAAWASELRRRRPIALPSRDIETQLLHRHSGRACSRPSPRSLPSQRQHDAGLRVPARACAPGGTASAAASGSSSGAGPDHQVGASWCRPCAALCACRPATVSDMPPHCMHRHAGTPWRLCGHRRHCSAAAAGPPPRRPRQCSQRPPVQPSLRHPLRRRPGRCVGCRGQGRLGSRRWNQQQASGVLPIPHTQRRHGLHPSPPQPQPVHRAPSRCHSWPQWASAWRCASWCLCQLASPCRWGAGWAPGGRQQPLVLGHAHSREAPLGAWGSCPDAA